MERRSSGVVDGSSSAHRCSAGLALKASAVLPAHNQWPCRILDGRSGAHDATEAALGLVDIRQLDHFLVTLGERF